MTKREVIKVRRDDENRNSFYAFEEVESVKIESEDGKFYKGIVKEGQRVGENGFIETVKYVEIPTSHETPFKENTVFKEGGIKNGEIVYISTPTERVIIDDNIKKVIVKKNGSIERWLSD